MMIIVLLCVLVATTDEQDGGGARPSFQRKNIDNASFFLSSFAQLQPHPTKTFIC
jgi:hypothetical protein